MVRNDHHVKWRYLSNEIHEQFATARAYGQHVLSGQP